MNPNHLNAYEVLKEEDLQDIHSKGWLLKHKRTGARVMLIENSDENKVLTLHSVHRQRTAPVLPTSWNTVYCAAPGNFRLRILFVELVKGSLNTFLNAMTYRTKPATL